MDNQEFQRENLEESIAVLGITMETRTCKSLNKPTQLQPHQIVAINSMVEKENSLVKGGLLADDCGTGKVRPCCARDILFTTLTIIRLWQHWLQYLARLMSMHKNQESTSWVQQMGDRPKRPQHRGSTAGEDQKGATKAAMWGTPPNINFIVLPDYIPL